MATEAASTLFETYSGTLAAGNYYVEIASHGGKTQMLSSYNTSCYFDMGSYFLTGSGLSPVPEPGACVMLATVACLSVVILRRARRRQIRVAENS